MPSWDNTARRGGQATVFQYATPEIYQQWLRHVIENTAKNAKPSQNFIFINAWNEWAEGAFLEPSQKSGRAWLEATLKAQNFTDYSTAAIDQAAYQSYIRIIASTRPTQEPPYLVCAASQLKEFLEVWVVGQLKEFLEVRVASQLKNILDKIRTIKLKLSKVKKSLAIRGPLGTTSLILERLKLKLKAKFHHPSFQVVWSQSHHNNGFSGHPEARIILFVSHDASVAGSQLAMLENLKYFTQFKELDCHLLLCQGGPLEKKFKKIAKTFNLAELMFTGLSREAAISLVVKEISERNPLMAFCNTVVTADVVEACYRAQIPVMSCIYELPASIETYVGKKQFLRIVNYAKRVIVASDYVQRELVNFYDVEPSKLAPIHAGIRHQRNVYSSKGEARKAVLKEFNFPEDTCLVLGCGSVHPRKGTDLFIQVAKKVFQHSNTDHVRFIWIGADQTGPMFRRWCEHDIRIASLADKVLLSGPREEDCLDPYFSAADIFLLPSREDPFPLVNLTAMSHGLPVIAFGEAGGAQEALYPDAGFVVPYIDTGAMAEILTSLIRSPELRIKVGEAAVEKCKVQYQWSRYVGNLVSVMNADFACGITSVPKQLGRTKATIGVD